MAEEIIIKTSLDTSKAESNTKSLKRELREAQVEAQNLGRQFGEFDQRTQAAARRAAELRDQLDDVNDAVRSFTGAGRIEAFTRAASAAAGGVQAATAAMTLFGVENENVGKALVQLQSAMALTQGLQALEDAPRAFKQLTTVITGTTVATKVNDVATKMATGTMSAFGVATTGTGAAFNVLKGAIISTGIGALVVAIGFAVNALVEWIGKTESAEEAQKKLNAEIEKQTESVKRTLDNATLRANAMKDGIDKEIQLRKLADQQILADLYAKHVKEKTAVEDYNERVRLIYELQNKDIADIRKKYADEADKKDKERREKALQAEIDATKERERIEKIDAEFRLERWEMQEEMRTIALEKEQKAFAESLEKSRKARQKELDLMETDLGKSLTNSAQMIITSEELSYQERLQALEDFRAKGKLTEEDYSKFKKQLSDAEMKAEMDKVQIIGGALNGVANLVGQQSEFGKIVGVATATIDTFVGAQKAVAQGGILGYVAAAGIIANGLANVNRIRQVNIPRAPGGGGSASVSMPSISPVITQTAISQTEPIQTTSVGNQRVFVVESDITNTQRRVDVLQGRGSVG